MDSPNAKEKMITGVQASMEPKAVNPSRAARCPSWNTQTSAPNVAPSDRMIDHGQAGVADHPQPPAHGAAHPLPAHGEHAEMRRPWTVLALMLLAQFMVILVSVVNVALPSIGRSLTFTSGDYQWVVSAYVLVSGSPLLFGGRRPEAGKIRQRHPAYYLAMAEEAGPAVTGPEAAAGSRGWTPNMTTCEPYSAGPVWRRAPAWPRLRHPSTSGSPACRAA
jgi:hypothetical protein